jgi:hypothetical protein
VDFKSRFLEKKREKSGRFRVYLQEPGRKDLGASAGCERKPCEESSIRLFKGQDIAEYIFFANVKIFTLQVASTPAIF